MTSTPIAKMVREMIARGVDPDVIELAVATAEQVAVGNSTGIPVDHSAEKRRAYDRERKRKSAEIRRNSTGTPRNEENASLSSESIGKEKKRESARGGRLPEEWKPTPIDQAMAEEMLGAEQTRLELQKFHDHWKQQPGSKGVKLDWPAAWRNWVRRAYEYAGNRNGNRSSNPRATGHDAILAAASRKASQLVGDDPLAEPAGSPEFPFGNGHERRGEGGLRGDADQVDRHHRGHQPHGAGVLEGEVIPPDANVARFPGGRRH